MGTYFHRFFVILLLTFVGAGILGSDGVYANGGSFDVPQVNDHFDKFEKGPAPKKEESITPNTQEEKGAWDWITKPVSGAWDWTVDKVSGAWEWTKEAASSLWDWFVGILEMITSVVIVVGSFLKGVWNAVVDVLAGIWNFIAHPIDSIKNIIHAIMHPIDTAKAIWKAISDSWERDVVNGDAKSRAEWFGYALGQIGLAIVGTKGADKAVKLGTAGKAVTGINKAVPDVPSKVFTQFSNSAEAQLWVTKHYANWPSSLTKAEYEAVRAYTGDNYYNINRVLRGLERSYEGNNEKYVELISQALNKYPVPEDVVVYRGTSIDSLGKLKNLPPDKLVGKTIQEKGFMSTSLDPSQAFHNDITYVIKVPKGTPGAYVGGVSRFPGEMELLLDKGREMVITEVKPLEGNRMEIVCELKR
jgi:hypothetical protein